MRQISIDLTSDRAKPPAQAVGCVGEHNATELLISVPQPLIDASDYQVVVFQSGPLTFRSRRIYPDSDRDGAYREGVCICPKQTACFCLTRLPKLSGADGAN